MIKYTKTRAIIFTIILVGSLLFASLSMQNKTATLSSSYEARKEDLISNQQQLENLILELNKTLQIVQAREQNLSNQVAILENKAAQQITTPAIIQTTPTPAVSVPVTRAS